MEHTFHKAHRVLSPIVQATAYQTKEYTGSGTVAKGTGDSKLQSSRIIALKLSFF